MFGGASPSAVSQSPTCVRGSVQPTAHDGPHRALAGHARIAALGEHVALSPAAALAVADEHRPPLHLLQDILADPVDLVSHAREVAAGLHNVERVALVARCGQDIWRFWTWR